MTHNNYDSNQYGTDVQRPRIVISEAERRREHWAAKWLTIEERLKGFLPKPKEDDGLDHFKSVILGTSGRIGESAATLENLRASLYSLPELAPVHKPPEVNLPIALSTHVMHLTLVFVALPVGLLMSFWAVYKGDDFRRTAQVMTLTGLALTVAQNLNLGLGV